MYGLLVTKMKKRKVRYPTLGHFFKEELAALLREVGSQ